MYIVSTDTVYYRGTCRKKNDITVTQENMKIKKISTENLGAGFSPLKTFGLLGNNKQQDYWEAYRHQLPVQYAQAQADIMDRAKKGWIVYNRKSNRVVYVNEKKELFWTLDFNDNSKRKSIFSA